MRDSPFQLLESFFQKVSVEVADSDGRAVGRTQFEKMELQFFDSIEHLHDFWETPAPTETAAAHTYRVTLGVRTAEDSAVGAYKFEIIVSGVVACMKENPEWPRTAVDLAHEHGKALLLGMAREQLASITARMAAGVRLLPTINFLGAKNPDLTPPSGADAPN